MREILSEIERWTDQGKGVAIATVVKAWGSSPRPIGSRLAVSSTDGSLFVLALDPVELLDLARARVMRSLTPSECAAYGIDPCPADA